MSAPLPPGVTIAAPPPELKLGDPDEDDYRLDWCRDEDNDGRGPDTLQAVTAFPERIEAGMPQALHEKLFACSGSVDSSRYQEATKFRAMPAMNWEEARVALDRLLISLARHGYRRYRTKTRKYVELAEFALTAWGFEEFVGRKGDNAVKLRKELRGAIGQLHRSLDEALQAAKANTEVLTRPITDRLRSDYAWRGNAGLWAMMPIAVDRWMPIIRATSDQVMGALEYLRATLATWQAKRSSADNVAERLETAAPPPSAVEYAEAVHIAEMIAFTSAKLVTLYAAIMHSIPVYRLYPATSEQEALALWWPWGRLPPLVDGGPPRPPRPAKQVLDPAIITATRPQDIVREVIERTGINRTTAQRLTAAMRAGMRTERWQKADGLLRQGMTKAEVARTVGLSPSRISAIFKGQSFPTKRTRRRPAGGAQNSSL